MVNCFVFVDVDRLRLLRICGRLEMILFKLDLIILCCCLKVWCVINLRVVVNFGEFEVGLGVNLIIVDVILGGGMNVDGGMLNVFVIFVCYWVIMDNWL